MDREHNRLSVKSERNIFKVLKYFFPSYLEVKDDYFKGKSQLTSQSNVKYNLKCSLSSIKALYSVHAYFWVVCVIWVKFKTYVQATADSIDHC